MLWTLIASGVVQSPTHPHPNPQYIPSDDQPRLSSTISTSPQSTQPTLHLLDDGDSDQEDGDLQTNSVNCRRYPARSHRPPSRLTDYLHH